MDTPQKTVGTPVSKFENENSPVFNYLNSLSPIKTVKSIPIAQTIDSLSFTSPTVFTSHHVASHKGSRFKSNSSDPVGFASTGEEVVEEALLETELSQIYQNDCTTPKVIKGGSCEDGETDLQNSPVFNYLNSLSPIKMVKSIPIAQTFGSLSFTSPPSVFTYPHVASHKGSRFKSNSSDPSKVGSGSTGEEAI